MPPANYSLSATALSLPLLTGSDFMPTRRQQLEAAEQAGTEVDIEKTVFMNEISK